MAVKAEGTSTDRTGQVQAALDAAVRAIAELAPVDDVLQIIVDQVRPVVGAQYAALGIVDDRRPNRAVHHEWHERRNAPPIGALPEGHGLLGLIIKENRSFRIPDLNVDPAATASRRPSGDVQLPRGADHRQRHSVGRLYLTNKVGADAFSPDDEALVETFALHAGIAMENARLHVSSSAWPSSMSANGSPRTCTTGSSRTCTRSDCSSRTCPR